MSATNRGQAVAWGRSRLAGAHFAAAGLEAELLLAHALGVDRMALLAWPETALMPQELAHYGELLDARLAGQPVAYLLGRQPFWSLELKVTEATLIPRPETELLVERALELPLPGRARVADLGTGSGAIALALASERPGWRLLASDRSAAALRVAMDNAARLALDNVDFFCGHWGDALAGGVFDLVVSNPPYVAADDPHLQRGDLVAEPLSALASGAQGLDDLGYLATTVMGALRPGGWLLVEHGWEQQPRAAQLFVQAGWRLTEALHDLAGHPRALLLQRPAAP